MKIFFSFYCLLASFCAFAQKPDKASRCMNDALTLNAKKQTEKACKKMEEAILIDPTNPDYYGFLGQWYFESHKFKEAADVFKRATANCRNGGMRFAKPLAKSLMYSEHPDGALLVIENYATVKEMTEWNKMKTQAEFIKKAMANPLSVTPVNLGIRINSPDPEIFPSMAVDTQHLYFTRRVNNMDEDFYKADWDTVCGGWLYARNLGSPPNSPNQEASQSISSDGHYLFFSRCENRSEDGWAEGGCDLYMAYRIANDSPWTVAQPFGATINTPAYEGMPSTSADCRELYFVSDRPGGYGGYDIWISRFENGLWQLPVNAGPNINTAGNETAPYMNLDDNTLYFTSDGWPGMGGSDIFVTRRINDTSYEKAVNLGYPINTAYDEKSACVTLDGKRLYFSSDRQGPAGNYDIYEASITASPIKPIPVSYIKGVVYDSLTKIRLNYAQINICNAHTGQSIYKFQSNRGDASFILTLHLNNTYAIHTQRIGYTDTHDTISFDQQYLQDPLVHNIIMLPSDYVKPVNDSLIATIHFDVNRVELSDSDKTTIYNALLPWMQDKNFVLFVNAYTDNTGTPMINEELSYKRASQVSKVIEAMNVDDTMIRSKGWGESRMIATNETPEGQRMNRRVEIIIRR
jgi:outer membrane protein OmpA-like peptidoglycan-associated protein